MNKRGLPSRITPTLIDFPIRLPVSKPARFAGLANHTRREAAAFGGHQFHACRVGAMPHVDPHHGGPDAIHHAVIACE